MKIIFSLFCLLNAFTAHSASSEGSASALYAIEVISNAGEKTLLSKYKGQVLLIVNTASKCGYTPQYKGLQVLQDRYASRGFTVLGFPSNDFGGQEPGSNAEIKKFCDLNYKVKFPLFEKAPVSGEKKQPLYSWLIKNGPERDSEVGWNFEKFLIGRDGKILARYRSKITPESPEVIKSIESALAVKK